MNPLAIASAGTGLLKGIGGLMGGSAGPATSGLGTNFVAPDTTFNFNSPGASGSGGGTPASSSSNSGMLIALAAVAVVAVILATK